MKYEINVKCTGYIFCRKQRYQRIAYSSNPYHYSSLCSYNSNNVHIHGTTVLVPYMYRFQYGRLFLPEPAHHITEIESSDCYHTACFHIHMLVTAPQRQSIATLLFHTQLSLPLMHNHIIRSNSFGLQNSHSELSFL